MKCPTCQSEVARNADACPNCGRKFTSNTSLMIGGLFVAVLLVLLVAHYMG